MQVQKNLRVFLIAVIITSQYLFSGLVLAEEKDSSEYSKHSVYLEAFGQGLLYSINYDRRIKQNISIRVGFSHWSVTPVFLAMTGKIKFTAIPVMLNRLIGKDKHYLELGVGLMPTALELDEVTNFFGQEYNESTTMLMGTATIGYRLQPKQNGMHFRFGLTPLFTLDTVATSFGISLGYSFK